MASVGQRWWQLDNTTTIIISLVAPIIALSACQSKPDSSQPANNPPTASRTAFTAQSSTPSSPNSTTAVTATPNKTLENSITLYTSQSPANLAPIFTEYKQKTGVTVNVVIGKPEDLVARLKAEDKNTPADLLLTSDVGTFAQAKQDSLFQPFSAEKINAGIPERFRSKSGEWAGVGYYARTAVYDSRVVSAKDISSYSN